MEIQKDGKFTHFYSKGKLTLKHSGTWKKDNAEQYKVVNKLLEGRLKELL